MKNGQAYQLNRYTKPLYSYIPKWDVTMPRKCPNCQKAGVRLKTEGITKPITFQWCYDCGWKKFV